MNLPHHGSCGEPPFDGGLELGSVAAHSYVKYIAASIVMSSIFFVELAWFLQGVNAP